MENPIKAYRASKQLSRRELAELLGVGVPAVFRWESGARKIDESLLPRISERTGIPAKELRPDLVEKHEAIFGDNQPEGTQ